MIDDPFHLPRLATTVPSPAGALSASGREMIELTPNLMYTFARTIGRAHTEDSTSCVLE